LVSEPTVLVSSSVEQTEHIAARLARLLRPGSCIALHGELGAGKTQFVRGLVRGLGGDPRQVSSPTFVLLNIYQTPRCPVYHLDAYRVSGAEDLEEVGFLELLDQPAVTVIEWAERVSSLLPANALHIHLDHESRPSVRTIRGLPEGFHDSLDPA
jgi:tRNA threonylcarbamoyladenosine biosynthesis protein TsaE